MRQTNRTRLEPRAKTLSNSGAALPRELMTHIGYLLNRPARQIRQMAQDALQPFGLIPPHFAVVSTLQSEGPHTQRMLGELLKIDATTMVWLIDDLEKKGFVRRDEHPEDRRAHLVKLTPSGVTLFRRAARKLDQLEKRFLEPLSKNEREDLKRLLTKLFKSVSTQALAPKCFTKEGEDL